MSPVIRAICQSLNVLTCVFHSQDVKLIVICRTAREKWAERVYMFTFLCMDNIFVIYAKSMPYYSIPMWLILNSVTTRLLFVTNWT